MKLHWTVEDVFGLPGMPEWARYAAIDYDGLVCIFDNEPATFDTEWNCKGRVEPIFLEADFIDCWKDSLLERPQEAKAGDFVKAWDSDVEPPDEDAVYGYIEDIRKYMLYIYRIKQGNSYKNIRLMNPPTRR